MLTKAKTLAKDTSLKTSEVRVEPKPCLAACTLSHTHTSSQHADHSASWPSVFSGQAFTLNIKFHDFIRLVFFVKHEAT